MPPADQAAASRPGFHLSATSPSGYVLVPEPLPVTADREAGYYVFLGCGDYPIITGRETHPLADWTLDQWRDLVTWMGRHGLNRLWVLLNGYTLAYPSTRYPELHDRHARNVRENFLGDLIDHAHTAGVQVYLMLTTDGHGRDFCRLHPEAVRRQADGSPGPHYGLCLEHPATQRYLDDVLTEVLTLYPQADGLAVHPTESDPERFNPESAAAFARETGRDLATATTAERHTWHNRTYARFLHRFFTAARRLRPGLDCVMANCWWQDDQPEIYRAELPADARVAVWYYEWGATTAAPWSLHQWLRSFPPERLIYMPTSQSFLCPAEPGEILARHVGTDRLISTALAHGVRNTLYFAGWDILDEPARLLDATLARHPTLRLAPAGERLGLVPTLYADYAGTRARLSGSDLSRSS